jgi:hypothetical protein
MMKVFITLTDNGGWFILKFLICDRAIALLHLVSGCSVFTSVLSAGYGVRSRNAMTGRQYRLTALRDRVPEAKTAQILT